MPDVGAFPISNGILSGACVSLPSASAVLPFHRMSFAALFRSFRWLAGSMRVSDGGGKKKL